MSVTVQVWLAIALIAGQGMLLGALFLVVRTFGAYANANVRIVLETHQQNMLIQVDNLKLADNLVRLEERATRRPIPPDHAEDCVA